MEIVFATNNANKVAEINSIVPNNFKIVSLAEAGIDIDIPEPYDTFQENALIKAATVYNQFGKPCFSEDTGLEIDALNGAPGVKSARYAGASRDFQANIDLVLAQLQQHSNRVAQFRTVICLMLDGSPKYFEGICEGVILEKPSGTNGFGYDPIFKPKGSSKSFAEMTMTEKNQYSHRKKAVQQLIHHLSLIGK